MNFKRSKLLVLTFILCLGSDHFSQTTNDLISFKSVFKYNTYVFYDLFREAGIGCEFRHNLKYSTELRLGYIIPDVSPLKVLDVNDYFMMKGIDISLFPKWQLKNKTDNYLGLWFSYQNSWYNNRLVEDKYNNMGTFNFASSPWLINDKASLVIRTRRSSLFIVGLTYSTKFVYRSTYIEPFVNVGCGFVSSKSTVSSMVFYSQTGYYGFLHTIPYYEKNQKLGGSANLGIKLGLGVQKSKRLDRYTGIINEINADVANLRKIVTDLRTNNQLSEVALDYFNDRINEIKSFTKKQIASEREPSDISFKTDEKLVSLIAYLKDHIFKKDAYITPITYKKPNGKKVTLTTYYFDLFEYKERIENYPDLILSNDDKEKLFASFYSEPKK